MGFGRFDNNGYDFLGRLFVQWRKPNFAKNDSKSIEILKYFIYNRIGSTYRCHKYMINEKKIKISYKNVLKKIKVLEEKGFIVKNHNPNNFTVDTEKGRHGAIYYILSSLGIFYLFSRRSSLELDASIILNHDESILFRNLLFPHIPLQTLKGLKSDFIWDLILRYLQNCCFTIDNAFAYISEQDYIVKPIEKIGGLLECDPFAIHLLIEGLRIGKRFDSLKPLESINHELLEQYLMDENGSEVLRISNKENHRILYFKILENKDKENKKKLQIYENDYYNKDSLIFEVDTGEDIRDLKGSYLPLTWKELIKFYFENDDYLLQMTNNLVELFLNTISIRYEIITSSNNNGKIKKNTLNDKIKINTLNDIKSLKNNSDFMDTFYIIKEFIETNFRNFEKLPIT